MPVRQRTKLLLPLFFGNHHHNNNNNMNRNHPQQQLRESIHSSTQPMSMDFARCRSSQQPYSFSYRVKPTSERARSIPICKAGLRRTASELKLTEDEATADFQDYVFFSRLLTGITKQQQESASDQFLQESDECLAHIIGTRNGSLDSIPSSRGEATSFKEGLGRSSRYEEEKDEGIFLMDM